MRFVGVHALRSRLRNVVRQLGEGFCEIEFIFLAHDLVVVGALRVPAGKQERLAHQVVGAAGRGHSSIAMICIPEWM